MTFTLAHLSDVHLGPLPRPPIRHWNLKRLLGYLNWHRSRKGVHLASTLARLAHDLAVQRPDHIAVTGDLVNIGLPAEYVAAEAWLHRLGDPARVTVVPGNHDIYTRLRGDAGVDRWRAFMSANAAGAAFGGNQPQAFPFVRRIGRVALIGLNSAVPTPPFRASGRLGEAQLARLGPILDRLGAADAIRVILIHHPPLPGQASNAKALQDAAALEAILTHHGAELVLHGHNHLSMLSVRRWSAGTIPVVGVPSASLGRSHKAEPLARYHLFRIEPGGTIEQVSRGLTQPDGPVVEIERRMLSGPCAHTARTH